MPVWSRRDRQAPNPHVRVLGPVDREAALALCARHPLTSTLAAVQVPGGKEFGGLGSRMLGVPEIAGKWDRYRSLCWVGANLVPVGTDEFTRARFAEFVLARGMNASSVVGDAEEVLALWDVLSRTWPKPREVRANQPVLVLDAPSRVEPDEEVRLGTPDEWSIVTPASVAMFTEEVGYDPTRYGDGYSRRVLHLLSHGRTYVRTAPDPATGLPRVVFKADVGAEALGVAQIQGVWVAPDMRGRGLATRGMAAVARHVLAHVAPVMSLYVNDYNTAALATYRRLGMRQEGQYATVVL